MAKHFDLVIGEANFTFHRKAAAIAAEAALDGIYVVRTSLPQKALDNAATVGAYKSLAQVERAFRSLSIHPVGAAGMALSEATAPPCLQIPIHRGQHSGASRTAFR